MLSVACCDNFYSSVFSLVSSSCDNFRHCSRPNKRNRVVVLSAKLGTPPITPPTPMLYVATLRELLEQLVAETTPEGLPRISKAMVNDYSEKIEALAAKLAIPSSNVTGPLDAVEGTEDEQTPPKTEEQAHVPTPILRRRLVSHPKSEDINQEIREADPSTPIKLDAAAQEHIEKHRKLQEDLTDEMVGLARQLKESSLMMSQSLQDTEKLLDSTEKAVEHSLASTGHANTRAMEMYSQSFKTTCFTWILIFAMTCIFVMVVLLIRVT